MNSENNNFNNGQNMNTVPVVPTTPTVNNSPITQPVVYNPTPMAQPVTTHVVSEVLSPSTTPFVQQQVVEPTTVPTTVVEPTSVASNGVFATPQPQVDNNAIVNENLKKVEVENYNPPSKFKVFVLLLFFVLLVAFIIFLPQISSYIRNYGQDTGNYQTVEEVITTGSLVCTMTSNTSDLDKEYEFDFSFTDSKLKNTKYIVYTRGDSTTENALDELAEKCKILKEETKELEGVTIKCDYTDGRLKETQAFELETVDTKALNAAFTEAGGVLPSYNYDQDIDEIEKNMKASGYSCERQK